jgi:hypothetical protein
LIAANEREMAAVKREIRQPLLDFFFHFMAAIISLVSSFP